MIPNPNSATPAPAPDNAGAVPHHRRPRYRGTHPRRFEEKYKELHPDQYPETVQKVMSSGKTPAGIHRPICVQEILEILAPKPGETAVDATLGYGGHAREILTRILPGGRLIGLDVDPLELPKTEARLRASGIPSEALLVIHTNFAGMARALAGAGIQGVDMVLADLGCSSMQLDDPQRGFSYKLKGPLDLRMNPHKGHPVSEMIQTMPESLLAQIFSENADEPHAPEIAAAIVEAREHQPIETTSALTDIVRRALSMTSLGRNKEEMDSCLKRVFQALRIEVNDEFGALDTFLRFLPSCLRPGGRVAILTFHSGEDRRVKKWFQAGLQAGDYESIARDVIRPTPEEIHSNPRSSSAKLRWAIRPKS
jgi:16S rRNA (cytosine1402-N4)-methyltransferase